MLVQNQKHICVNCGKGVQYANLVSFSKNRTHTIRKPNLHTIKVLIEGVVIKQRLCTKCMKKAIRPHKVAMELAARLAQMKTKKITPQTV